MDETVREFVAEASEGIEALDSKLVALEQNPDNPELLGEIFRLIHSIKGASGFLGLQRLQSVAHSAENVLGAFRDGELAVDGPSISAILEAFDVIRSIVEALAASGAEPAGDDSALVARLDAIFEGGADAAADAPPAPPEPEAAPAAPLMQRLGGEATLDCACEMVIGELAAHPAHGEMFAGQDPDLVQNGLRGALVGMTKTPGAAALLAKARSLAPAVQDSGLSAMLEAFAHALADLGADQGAIDELLKADPAPADAAPPAAPAEDAPAQSDSGPARPAEPAASAQTIRVGVDTLEGLMATVSELVLIRNQLLQTLRGEPETPFAGPLHRLNQVTSELQEGVMTTRMQPISGAWAKLPRLVRDLAADLGKKIDLVTSGQDTELDRQVLELIKDPLTHMIRNAADHGLETPEKRRAAGKPETGRITLQARHEGGAIIVEMSDDGRGLPADKIRDKAVASGVVPPDRAAAMSDAEARQLIFMPGFSMAKQVTAVSGRGVGMDVVRTNIEKIGGAIELTSTEGRGTRFTIRIPLTLSIVSALIVECCGERFAMSQAGIVELVSANGSEGRRIEQINGALVLRLRDRLLPLVSLQALLGLPEAEEPRTEDCIVVARVGSFVFGVIVDKVFDTEEIVVKPVASILRHLKLYSGATILGDGSVIMILDFKGISAEAGAAHLMNGAEDAVAEAVQAPKVQTEQMLIFRAGQGAPRAAPLSRVARIEEVAAKALERADGRTVLQFRERLMPVVGIDGGPVAARDDTVSPLLVFTRDERSFGLKVDEIVDIVEASAASDLAGGQPGSAGNIIVSGAATELIDIDHYWDRAYGAARAPRGTDLLGDASGQTGAGGKRLLVIDASPFSKLLLRPLLSQAGYAVEVASGAESALALHEAGESFDLILADMTSRGEETRRLAGVLGQADRWHATPLLGLGAHELSAEGGLAEFAGSFDSEGLLDDVSRSLSEEEAA